MNIITIVERQFWIFLLVSCIFALIVPFFGKYITPFLVPSMMVILYLTYLKIDYREIVTHLKHPLFLLYILIMYLLVIPLGIFYLFRIINIELAISFLLLSSISPGVGSPLLTDLAEGSVSLSTTITLIASVVAPFSLIFLLSLTSRTDIHMDLIDIFKTLTFISFIPLFVAQLTRIFFLKIIRKTQKYYSVINIFLLTLFVYGILSNQANSIVKNLVVIIPSLLWLYVLFIVLHIIGFYMAFWRTREERIAISVTKTYMNCGLAIIIAYAFLTPKIALIIVLSEIPWNTLLGGFKYINKYLP